MPGRSKNLYPDLTIETATSSAQDTQSSLYADKYFKYKEILQTKRMLLSKDGTEQSTNLPAYLSTDTTFSWGDATIYVGWYMMSLALEYGLADNPAYQSHADRSQIIEQLTAALTTINRLDRKAGQSFPCDHVAVSTKNSELNGFFIRDDVREKDVKQVFPNTTAVSSDYLSTDPYAKEESFDQIHHLLLGLAVVIKFVNDPDVTKQALDIAERIVNWPSQRFLWRIHNPACYDKVVERGGTGFLSSFLLSKALLTMSDGKVNFDSRVSLPAKAVGYLEQFSNPFYGKDTTLHMVLSLAVVAGNAAWSDNTGAAIKTLSTRHNWPVYPLLFACLHLEGQARKDYVADLMPGVEEMLDSAPDDGTSHDGSPNGWKASHRFLYNISKQNGGQAYQGQRYCGVDVMALATAHDMIESEQKSETCGTMLDNIVSTLN